MRDEDDFLKTVSDFIKGKAGNPDQEIAELSFEGGIPPEAFLRPKTSHTFSEFAAEYPLVASGLRSCSLKHCLAVFGAMLTMPEFHSNGYRLQVLVHLAFLFAKGKKKPTPAHIVAWFNQLDDGTCGRMEDPAEDVFIVTVWFESVGYRLLQGTTEANGFLTQIVLDVLAQTPDVGEYKDIKDAVRNLLKLSDTIAQRTAMPVYGIANTSPVGKISKPSAEDWSRLRRRATFTLQELSRAGISAKSLADFFAIQPEADWYGALCPGHNPVETHPLFLTDEGMVVFLPSSIGIAIRAL